MTAGIFCAFMLQLAQMLVAGGQGLIWQAWLSEAILQLLILGEVATPTSSLRNKLECLDAKAKIYRKNGGGR